MFSRRTEWDLSPNRISATLSACRESGRRILDLTETNPTRCGLGPPAEALASAISRGAAAAYEPDPMGDPAARASLAADYRARGVAVPADRLLLTASTSEAYAHLFRLLANPGDNVLVPTPSYPLFEHLADISDVTLGRYPLTRSLDFAIDLDALVTRVDDRTRAILVVNPGNPTGTWIKRGEAAALHALCRDRAIALISDEVFSDFPFAEDPDRVATLAGPAPALTFALNGLSKMLALPQLKLSWIAVGGPEPAAREAICRLELISDTFLSVNTPVQRALPELLAMRGPIQRTIRERLAANRRTLADRVVAHPACRLPATEGGWSALIEVPRTRTEEEWVIRALKSDGVLVHPGFFFNFDAEGMLVLSLLPPPEVFAEGVERLLRRIQSET